VSDEHEGSEQDLIDGTHSDIMCQTSTRDLNGISLTEGCSFDAKIKKSLFGSKVESVHRAHRLGYVCISKS
jgi:hypothetical protein